LKKQKKKSLETPFLLAVDTHNSTILGLKKLKYGMQNKLKISDLIKNILILNKWTIFQ
jgi:hypothetical protein